MGKDSKSSPSERGWGEGCKLFFILLQEEALLPLLVKVVVVVAEAGLELFEAW
jgi:hypothetical protein